MSCWINSPKKINVTKVFWQLKAKVKGHLSCSGIRYASAVQNVLLWLKWIQRDGFLPFPKPSRPQPRTGTCRSSEVPRRHRPCRTRDASTQAGVTASDCIQPLCKPSRSSQSSLGLRMSSPVATMVFLIPKSFLKEKNTRRSLFSKKRHSIMTFPELKNRRYSRSATSSPSSPSSPSSSSSSLVSVVVQFRSRPTKYRAVENSPPKIIRKQIWPFEKR